MIFDWFRIFHYQDFVDLDVPQAIFEFTLEGYGEKTFFATNGNDVGVLVDDVFLVLNLNGEDPFIFSGMVEEPIRHYAIQLHQGYVHIGFEVVE